MAWSPPELDGSCSVHQGSKAPVAILCTNDFNELKVNKARLVMTLEDSPDPVIRNVQQVLKTEHNWIVSDAVEVAENQLKMNEITQSNEQSSWPENVRRPLVVKPDSTAEEATGSRGSEAE